MSSSSRYAVTTELPVGIAGQSVTAFGGVPAWTGGNLTFSSSTTATIQPVVFPCMLTVHGQCAKDGDVSNRAYGLVQVEVYDDLSTEPTPHYVSDDLQTFAAKGNPKITLVVTCNAATGEVTFTWSTPVNGYWQVIEAAKP